MPNSKGGRIVMSASPNNRDNRGSRGAMKRLADSAYNKFVDDNGHLISIKKWISPIKPDYKEFWDINFLSRIPLSDAQKKTMSEFWPKGGPHWDGIAISNDGEILLIEAKAYIGEFSHTKCHATSTSSLSTIKQSLAETSSFLQTKTTPQWLCGYYQTANRLAHLYKLNSLPGVSARLVYIFFSNTDMSKTSETPDLWRKAFQRAEIKSLGLPENHKLSDKISILFIDASKL